MGFNVAIQRTPVLTAEGGRGFKQDPKTELYRLVVNTLMFGDTFYEKANERLERFLILCKVVSTHVDGSLFLACLTNYARHVMNLRTLPTVLAAEMFLLNLPHAENAARCAWFRGDEHLEALSYVKVRNAKRQKSLLRAVSERLNRLTQRQAIKYAAATKAYSQRDAIRVSHPVPKSAEQSALFKYLVHGWDKLSPEEQALLPLVSSMKDQGESLTWEQYISKNGSTRETWQHAVTLMGYMAALRNLRNLIEKDAGETALQEVCRLLTDPRQVAASRQLPFRFLNAYRSIGNEAPSYVLDAVSEAMNLSVTNVPHLEGESLILVDTSGSMTSPLSTLRGRPSETRMVDAAACLGAILAYQGNSEVWAWSTTCKRVPLPKGTPCLTAVDQVVNTDVGCATYLGDALRRTLRKPFKRVVILTDMQCHDDAQSIAAEYLQRNRECYFYVVDMSGYPVSSFDPRNTRILSVGGFSEKVFSWMEAVEQGDPLKKIMEYGCEASHLTPSGSSVGADEGETEPGPDNSNPVE